MQPLKSFSSRRPATEALPPFQVPQRHSLDVPSMAPSSLDFDTRGPSFFSSLTPPDSSDASGNGDGMSPPDLSSFQAHESHQGSQGQSVVTQPNYTFGNSVQSPYPTLSNLLYPTSPDAARQHMPMSQYEPRPSTYSQAPAQPTNNQYALPSPTHSSPGSLQSSGHRGPLGPLPSTYGGQAQPPHQQHHQLPHPPPHHLHPSQQGHPLMAPPQHQYRPNFFQQMPLAPGHMVPNMHAHNGQMPLVQGNMTVGQPQFMYASAGQQPLDRPFKCDVCVQSFSRNHDLKRHKRIHLAVKPFPCDYCGKQFSRKDALKRHRLVKGCEENAKKKARYDSAPGEDSPSTSDPGNPIGNGNMHNDSPSGM